MIYWNQETNAETIDIPDDVVDLLFELECRQIPVDHAFALTEALSQAMPWLKDEPLLAVQSIHVAGSQNGWERPTHGSDSYLLLSHRTRLKIRAPKHRAPGLLRDLPGTRIEIGGCPLRIGPGKIRNLSRETTLIARYVVSPLGEDEDAFLARVARALGEMGIRVRKALCGKSTPLEMPAGPLHTRSLLLADLSVQDSFTLQRLGLGPNRLMGCGVFIPHKGVDPVPRGH